MGRLDGKVAFITGAARGQGRAHAIRMAQEGCDIVAIDICENIESVPYGLGTWAELQETATEVEKLDRRIVIEKADVRDRETLIGAVENGTRELGRLDVVVANSGIWSSAPFLDMTDETYQDMIDVQMNGTYNTCKATVPYLVEQDEGGSIVIISSTAGFKGFPHQAHYNMAKHAVVGLMRTLANELGPKFIRVNTVHPGAVLTPMIDNPAIFEAFAPDNPDATLDDLKETWIPFNLLPVPFADPIDVSHAVVYLASEESRYVTGVTLPVDIGFIGKA